MNEVQYLKSASNATLLDIAKAALLGTSHHGNRILFNDRLSYLSEVESLEAR